MQFKFVEITSIPRLSWCALISPGQKIVKIIHGSGVEVYEDWFFEGAWDGPFDGPGFAEATDCMGTGARILNDAVEFVSPSHPLRGLVALRTPKQIFISNSLPFLLAQADDKPDIEYLNYYQDLFNNSQSGFVRRPRPLRMRKGSKVDLHFCCNINFMQNQIQKSPKLAPAPPTSFEDYRGRLVAMLVRVRENATDPRRKQVYKPLMTLSRGYDSVACAALGAAAGWKDSITMVPRDKTDADNDDDGTPVAECLGLSIEKFYTQAWRKRTDVPETEFVATAWGGLMVRFASMEDRLRDTLLTLGNLGGIIWSPDSGGIQSNWQRPGKQQMGAESLWEFQLRVGFITVYPATYLATHWGAIQEIMTQEEMGAWSIGGDYDRPLPRRIAEEMSVPRELFGQRKMASSHDYPFTDPSVNGYEDYVRFLIDTGVMKQPGVGEKFTLKLNARTPHFFHWGIERILPRYSMDTL